VIAIFKKDKSGLHFQREICESDLFLRDARRLVGKGNEVWGRGYELLTPAAIDRAISRYGAKAPLAVLYSKALQARFAPKGTSEVDGSTQSGDLTHGGDGSSAEVEHAAATGKEHQTPSPPVGAGEDGEHSPSHRHDGGDAERSAGANAAEGAGAKTGTESHEDEVTEGGGDPGSDQGPASADDPGREASDAAGADDGPDGSQRSARTGQGEAASPRVAFGGVYAALSLGAPVPFEHRQAARDILRALRRLVAAVASSAPDQQSPRYDGRKLISELVSRRCAVGRARREELGLPRLVVACDVSGSCSSAAPGTIAAAQALTAARPDVVVVEHSNGFPLAVTVNGARRYADRFPRTLSWWKTLVPADSILLAFGDWDAGDIYVALAQTGRKVIWLDSYAARAAGVRRVRKGVEIWTPEAGVCIRHWYTGVNSPARAAIALRDALRKGL